MSLDLAQDILATIIAAGALAVVVRHVFIAVRPRQKPECANCPLVQDAAPPARSPRNRHPA